MDSDLQKLRIDKTQKARRETRATWPWLLLIALIFIGAGGVWQWHNASATPLVQTVAM